MNLPSFRKLLADTSERVAPLSQIEMALDTLASILRILGEHVVEQENQDPETFVRMCEQWAQHVSVASPTPTAGDGLASPGGVAAAVHQPGTPGGFPDPPATDSARHAELRPRTGPASAAGGAGGLVKSEAARRDWAGVRDFVRDYCKSSTSHTRTVMTDLRQVIWVFIQNLNHSFAQDHESDNRIKDQLGRLEVLVKGSSTGELKREVLATVVNLSQIVEERRKHHHERVEALGTQVKILGNELETARKESEVDPLTRLFNRKAFDEYATRTAELSQAFGQPSCMLLIDIDYFKAINDTFGHPQGDAVLRRIADAMTRIFLRKSDFVARYGGDELAVVLRETTLKEGVTLADRLLRAVRAIAMEREGVRLQLTVSVGLAGLLPNELPRSWLERTDRALYESKRTGRDRLVAAD